MAMEEKTETTSEEMTTTLRHVQECEICYRNRYITDWIILCQEGHSVCYRCWRKIIVSCDSCPFCRRDLLYVVVKDRIRGSMTRAQWMTFHNSVTRGQWIEAQDKRRTIWYTAEILRVTSTRVLVHFIGWSSKWNEWIPRSPDFYHPLDTHIVPTLRVWVETLGPGSWVEYCLFYKRRDRSPKWYNGRLFSICVSKKHALVELSPQRASMGSRYLKIIISDPDRIAPLNTHTQR